MKRVTALFLVLTMLVPMLLQPMAAAIEAAAAEIPISREKPATASINDNTATPQEAAVDGNDTTRWGTKNVVFPAWVKIDLGAVYNIGYYDILWFVSGTRNYYYNIWVSDTDNWVSNTSVGSYTKVLDKTANTTPGRVEDEVDTSYMARYVLIDVTGRSTSSGNASISEVNIYGWRLLSGGGYTVDEPNKSISGIGYGVTAADLLAAIGIDGNAEISVVDAGGAPVAGNMVLDSTHKLKAACTQGTSSALYGLSFTGLVSSDEYLVDYGMRTIDLQGRADVTIADFLTDITYDGDAYSIAFYESGGSKIESNDTVLAADMTLKVYAVSDAGETTPLDGYTFKDDAVAVAGVTLNRRKLDLPKGGAERLTAAITPEDATDTRLKWSSNDPAVATVSSDGLVTAVAEGTATITVKSYDGLQSDSCEVTVGLALEDGYALWLRYNKIADAGYRASASAALGYLVTPDEVDEEGKVDVVLVSALKELKTGLSGLFGAEMEEKAAIGTAGGIVIGTKGSAEVTRLLSGDAATLAALQEEGYLIKSVDDGGKAVTVIAGGGANGVLYGAFKLLELVQCGEDVRTLNYSDAPEIQWRVLQQWDNWDGSIERGYAGSSIYKWSELPGIVDPRYEDFARANASVGINTIVINNVNAQSDYIKTENNIKKVAAVADVFRKYGIRLALTVRFDSPKNIDGLETNDPLDPTVVTWWQDKFDEIYKLIPDFAGVLVKADSEGQPGPSSYGRTHADGANMFADILDDHDAIVMWRTFVYGPAAKELSSERVNQAYSFFKPLDGQFADNVIVQSKNGAWDFLPREPVAPLFGGLTKTNIGIELQITQEYTGQSTHVCYLVPMWKSYLDTDLMLTADNPDTSKGTTLDRVVDGTVYRRTNSLVAGVSNVGSDRNWTRLELAQANWYGFGKLAWNPRMAEGTITDTWTKMTFSNDAEVVETVGEILRDSWETVEAYLMPYAIGMTVDSSTHFSPSLSSRNGASSGISVDASGVGSNRNSTSTGNNSDATAQYSATLGAIYNNIDTCPEELIGWFHHVPYDRPMSSKGGKTMIQSLYEGFIAGPVKVEAMKTSFAALGSKIDAARMSGVLSSFDGQINQAEIWKNAMMSFFKKQSGIEIEGVMNLPGTFSVAEYAPVGTVVDDGAVVLTAGQSVTLQASTQQGNYLAALFGTGTNAKVAVKIGGAAAETITVDTDTDAWCGGETEIALSVGNLLDTITLSVTQGSVRLTSLKITPIHPLSFGKTVAGSSQETANPIGNIVDGDPGTRWAASNSNYPQWAKIDLGEVYNIGYYDLSWYISGNRTYQYNIWASTDTDDWVSNANVGSYTKVLDKTANATVGRVKDEAATPYMARYILIDTTGKTPAAGSGAASLYAADIFGWRVESSKYIVDEPSKKISAVDLDATASELLENISINGNATAIVVDGGGNRVPDSTQLTAAHKLKVTCTRGAGSAQYTLELAEGPAPTVPVSGVSLNKDTVSLLVGGTESLTATVAPADASDKTVTWMSSNEAAATVMSSGVVTAAGVGTATITATTADGGLTAACVVTVKANITAVASVAGITVVYGTDTETMAAGLPATVEVTVSGGTTAQLPVVWSTKGYNAAVAGSYLLTGALTLPSDGNVTNTSDLKANVTVTVKCDITGVDAIQGYSVPLGTELSNLPVKAYVTVSGGGRRELEVVWRTESYDKERAGTYILDGALTLEPDLLNTGALKASLTVTVLEEGTIVREVTGVANIAAKQVSYGTAAGNLGLPTKVIVTLDDGSETELEVVWNTLEYNGNLAGTYTLTGGLVEAGGIINPNGLTAEIKITVQAQTGGGGKPITPPKDTEPVVKPPVTVDKETGAATSTVSARALTTALEAAKKTESDVIVIRPAAPEGTSNVTVTIPAASAGVLGEEKKAVVVDTSAVRITIGSTGLSGLSNGARTISIGASVNEDSSMAITVKADAGVIGKVDGGIVVTVPGIELGGTTVAILIREDGTEVLLPKSVATADGMLVQLDGSATIKVIDNAKSLHDVPSGQWMTDAVAFVAAHGLFNGTAEGKFSPETGMTRSMLTTVLHRLELAPAGSGVSFTDVADGQWYSGAVSWGAEAGIVSGVGGGRFDGDREISRAELVTMLYRYAGHIGLDTSAAADLSAFTDSEAVPGWSADAFAWAVSTGIISGSDDGELLPTASATRAQVAKVMMELVKTLVG